MKSLIVFASMMLVILVDSSNLQGAKLVTVLPETDEQLSALRKMFMNDTYDFWTEPTRKGVNVDIMVTASQMLRLNTTINQYNLTANVKVNDVGSLVEEQMTALHMRGSRIMDWTEYHDFHTISEWLTMLASNYPDVCTVEEVGKSFHGRGMNLVTIGKGGANKPAIFIDGGMHGREWISPATVTYMINELVTNRNVYNDLLSNVNFYVMPIINPDGYAYTFTDNRMWRKTRSHTDGGGNCIGVDPNRNWDIKWMEVGASNNPCDGIYAGPYAFSEREMQVVRDQLNRLKNNIKVYLTFHSYGQKWMYPWGYTADLPHDWKDLDTLAREAVLALTAVHGTLYDIGSSTNTIYAAAGGSDDWAKAKAGIKYSYVVELRDTGANYFLLPSTEIIPSGQETFEALKVIANFVKNTYST